MNKNGRVFSRVALMLFGLVSAPLCLVTLVLWTTNLALASTAATSGSSAGVTWSISVNNTGATIDPATGFYQPTRNPGIDTIRAVDANGVVGTITYEVRPVAIQSAAISLHECSMLALSASGGSHGFKWQVVSGPANFFGNPGATKAHPEIATGRAPILYSLGTPGRVEILAIDDLNPANKASAFVDVLPPPYLELVGAVRTGGIQYSASTTSFVSCTAGRTSVGYLKMDQTLRASVGSGNATRYNAAVTAGSTYVISMTGVVGAAQLAVFSDAALTQPIVCLSPNLTNSTYSQPADCSFVATSGGVYATVSGTGGGTSDYNIRISPRFVASAATEGTEANPRLIVSDTPYGGTSGPNWSDYSYYVVNTVGTGDVVISMTGLTGAESLDLHIYDNPSYIGALNNANCYFGEPGTYAESCVLPAGKTYYVSVKTASSVGGPFTLMVDSPLGSVAPPAAATPNVMQQALPASSSAP